MFETNSTVGESAGRTKAEFVRTILVADAFYPHGDRSRRGSPVGAREAMTPRALTA
jgi:hypothetical protein